MYVCVGVFLMVTWPIFLQGVEGCSGIKGECVESSSQLSPLTGEHMQQSLHTEAQCENLVSSFISVLQVKTLRLALFTPKKKLLLTMKPATFTASLLVLLHLLLIGWAEQAAANPLNWKPIPPLQDGETYTIVQKVAKHVSQKQSEVYVKIFNFFLLFYFFFLMINFILILYFYIILL